MCLSPGGGNNAPQFAGTTELEDSGAVWCNGAVVLSLYFFLVGHRMRNRVQTVPAALS